MFASLGKKIGGQMCVPDYRVDFSRLYLYQNKNYYSEPSIESGGNPTWSELTERTVGARWKKVLLRNFENLDGERWTPGGSWVNCYQDEHC